MDEELRHHLECEAREHVRGGMSPAEAERLARVELGGVEQVKEQARDARGTRALEDLAADVGYGARVLRRSRAFTAASVLTFALGAGASTAVFSVVYGVLLRPLPFPHPERLVVLWERSPTSPRPNVVSVANFEAWRERSDAFSGMAALVPRPVTLSRVGPPERLAGAEVSPTYFRLLGVGPALGRDFEPGDAESRVVILSHGLWTRRFGADPGIVGRSLVLGGVPHSVVGVMPAGFEPPQFGWLGEQELWFPFVASPENRAWGRFLLVVGRLAPGVSLEGARARMLALADRLAREVKGDAGWSASVVPLATEISGDVRTALIVLQGAVCLLLLIAVTNVGTLGLSHTLRRVEELATRRALGASDRRLFRQLLTQSALVAALGGGVGCLVAWPALRLLVWLAPDGVPRLDDVGLAAPVLLATLGVTGAATLLFGAVAARGIPEAAFARAIRGGGGRTTAGAGGTLLVTLEIAVALALGVMAALAARTLVSLRAVDLGFRSEGVVAARVALGGGHADSPAQARAAFEALLERLRALPGVQAAGIVNTRPFGGSGPATEVADAQPTQQRPGAAVVADVRLADAGFFRTLRVPAERGVLFERREGGDGPLRVVVSRGLADALWLGEEPVGRRLRLELYGGITADVIGVVPDLHLMDARTAPRPTAYLAEGRFPDSVRDLVVRVDGDPTAVVPGLRGVLASLEPDATLYRVTPLPGLVAGSLARERFTARLLSAFAGLAWVLSAVGIFGVISTEVATRRREIGIRMAVGARPSRVVLMLLRQALSRASLGVAAGVGLSVVLGRLMKSLLFGVPPDDSTSLLTAVLVAVAVVALATLLPALQAARSSSLAALREG
jgi:putative ABC transport system permease protein